MSLRVPYGAWPFGWRAEDAAWAPRTVNWTGFAGGRVRWVAADPADGRNHLLTAGGWTALRALVDEPGLFRADAVSFPVLDAAAWAAATHDSESRYAGWLIGDAAADRSPMACADRIRSSVLLMQGTREEICLPQNADRFVERLSRSSVAVRYLRFRHEGHGLRDSGVVAEFLRAELALYGSALGFLLPEDGAELS